MAKVKEDFIIKIDGKDYITYEGLLDLAHSLDLNSIKVDLIQIPHRENNMVAICKATATTKDNRIFVDLGDASPNSVQSNFIPHIIRMASTRAKARALRDLTNVGITAIEELSLDNSSSYKPTQGQITTLKKLSKNTNTKINFNNLTQKSAGELIKKLQK